MSTDAVAFTVSNEVARLRLNRPDRRNAWSPELVEGLIEGLKRAESSDARCLVLEAAGDAFCAGGDLEQAKEWRQRPFDERLAEAEETHRDLIRQLVRFPLPTIAKVDGPAVGGGATLVAACDIQVASERAKIGFVFRNAGLCIDSGTSYVLSRLVGENTAKHLAYTGRVLDAEEAGDIGLFTAVHPAETFEEQAEELVSEISNGPTVALKFDKRLLTGADEKSLDAALDDEAMAIARVADTEDHAEGIEAFLEERQPEFVGR